PPFFLAPFCPAGKSVRIAAVALWSARNLPAKKSSPASSGIAWSILRDHSRGDQTRSQPAQRAADLPGNRACDAAGPPEASAFQGMPLRSSPSPLPLLRCSCRRSLDPSWRFASAACPTESDSGLPEFATLTIRTTPRRDGCPGKRCAEARNLLLPSVR